MKEHERGSDRLEGAHVPASRFPALCTRTSPDVAPSLLPAPHGRSRWRLVHSSEQSVKDRPCKMLIHSVFITETKSMCSG